MVEHSSPDLVKQINTIFHDVEAHFYDARHPEIMDYERDRLAIIANAANRVFPDTASVLCVDIGTGTGFVPDLFMSLRNEGDTRMRWVLSDISLRMLQRARSKLQEKGCQVVGCVVMDAERPAFQEASFDLITVNSVLHHLPAPQMFLSRCSELLRSRGLLLVSHEPRLGYYRSLLSPFTRLLQYAMAAVYRFRAALRTKQTSVSKLNRSFWQQVESRLEDAGIKGLSQRQVQQLVDFHSPTAGGTLNSTRGIDMESLLASNWEVLELQTYAHLGKLALKCSKRSVLRYLDRVFFKVFPLAGSLFCFLARKA